MKIKIFGFKGFEGYGVVGVVVVMNMIEIEVVFVDC